MHDVYKTLRQSFNHQKRIHVDPKSSTNFASTVAFAASFIASCFTLSYLTCCIMAVDTVMLSHIITWVCNID